jgi:hypothetical protein
MAGDERRENGNAISWGSIKLRIAGNPYYGFKNLKLSEKLERVLGYGMGAHHGPRVRSKGKYTPNLCGLTGFKRSVQQAREDLAAQSPSGQSYGNVEFDVIAQFVEVGGDPIVIELLRCTWTENSEDNDESPDPLTEDFQFQPMRIKRNGFVLYDDEDGDPN